MLFFSNTALKVIAGVRMFPVFVTFEIFINICFISLVLEHMTVFLFLRCRNICWKKCFSQWKVDYNHKTGIWILLSLVIVGQDDFLINGSAKLSWSWIYMDNFNKCKDTNGAIRNACDLICNAWAIQIFWKTHSRSLCISTWSATLKRQQRDFVTCSGIWMHPLEEDKFKILWWCKEKPEVM